MPAAPATLAVARPTKALDAFLEQTRRECAYLDNDEALAAIDAAADADRAAWCAAFNNPRPEWARPTLVKVADLLADQDVSACYSLAAALLQTAAYDALDAGKEAEAERLARHALYRLHDALAAARVTTL